MQSSKANEQSPFSHFSIHTPWKHSWNAWALESQIILFLHCIVCSLNSIFSQDKNMFLQVFKLKWSINDHLKEYFLGILLLLAKCSLLCFGLQLHFLNTYLYIVLMFINLTINNLYLTWIEIQSSLLLHLTAQTQLKQNWSESHQDVDLHVLIITPSAATNRCGWGLESHPW